MKEPDEIYIVGCREYYEGYFVVSAHKTKLAAIACRDKAILEEGRYKGYTEMLHDDDENYPGLFIERFALNDNS